MRQGALSELPQRMNLAGAAYILQEQGLARTGTAQDQHTLGLVEQPRTCAPCKQLVLALPGVFFLCVADCIELCCPLNQVGRLPHQSMSSLPMATHPGEASSGCDLVFVMGLPLEGDRLENT